MKHLKFILSIAAFLLLITPAARAWTSSPITAIQDEAGDWRLRSIPQELLEDSRFLEMGHRGLLACVTIVRDEGLWEQPIYGGQLGDKDQLLQQARIRIEVIKKSLDDILPVDELVVMTFLVDYSEIIVYFHTDRWTDEKFHKQIAARLQKKNKLRAQ